MGDRYTISLNCAYCNFNDDDVWYAPSCGSLSFRCEKCGEENLIVLEFIAKKVSSEELKQIYKAEGFE